MTQPEDRTDFKSGGYELGHLSDLMQHALDRGKMPKKRDMARFELLLETCGRESESIAHQEYWCLLHEVKGEIEEVIKHRLLHIQSLEKLFSIGGPVDDINEDYLASALRALAESLAKAGRVDEAAEARQKANRVASGQTLD